MRTLVAVAALAAACACVPGHASAAAPALPVWAGTCGLPSQTTTWMDFGQPQFLQQFGRPGVPLYVLYPAKNEEPIVFPEVLTKGMILDKLETVASRVASQ